MEMYSLVFITAALLCGIATPGWAVELPSKDASDLSDSRSTSAEDVLNRISKHSGYRIELIGELPSSSFQMSAADVSQPYDLVPSIRRLLSKADVPAYVLITDKIEKTVTIIVAGVGNGSPAAGVDGSKEGVSLEATLGSRPSESSLDSQRQLHLESLASLRELHRQQSEDLHGRMNEPESEDMMGMKTVERWTMHAEQSERLTRTKSDPDSISELDGMTNQRPRQMHREQQGEIRRIQNDLHNDDVHRENQARIWAKYDIQYAQFLEVKKSPHSINLLD